MTDASTRQDGRPSLQFYPADWRTDTAVQLCSLAARGLWIEILCLMFQSPKRGCLLQANGKQIEASGLAKLVGVEEAEVKQMLSELEANAVYSTLDDGTVYNRRMYRQWKLSETRAKAGRKGGRASKKQAKPPASSSFPPPFAFFPDGESSNEDSCAEPDEPAAAPPASVLIFPVKAPADKPKEWNLTQAKLDEYAETFVGMDVVAECRKARQWCIDNSAKRKTGRGMPAFLSRWMTKANDNGRGSFKPKPADDAPPGMHEMTEAELLARFPRETLE
ncbi:MAG TPA: hypothetical protein VMY35_10150 [Phycisphaerae bacterium]|nr:hypothetical protein [Phycisphaerae bacterium]